MSLPHLVRNHTEPNTTSAASSTSITVSSSANTTLHHILSHVLTTLQVTVIQVDAADNKATSDVCHRTLREEGRLDLFPRKRAYLPEKCSPMLRK